MKDDIKKIFTPESLDKLLKDVDAEGLVDRAVERHLKGRQKRVDEAFYASAKPAPQVTEYVTQRTKDAHDALYRGHIDVFNRTSAELDSVNREAVKDEPGPFRALHSSLTRNLNSYWLHELFFANCFDPNSQIFMDSISFLKLQSTFGTFDDWQRDFMACAHACEQGWVVCGYNLFLRSYVNTIVTLDSMDAMMGLYPVIVLDMHEHSRRDYLNDKQSYIIAMMRELRWSTIDERFERAEKLANVVRT